LERKKKAQELNNIRREAEVEKQKAREAEEEIENMKNELDDIRRHINNLKMQMEKEDKDGEDHQKGSNKLLMQEISEEREFITETQAKIEELVQGKLVEINDVITKLARENEEFIEEKESFHQREEELKSVLLEMEGQLRALKSRLEDVVSEWKFFFLIFLSLFFFLNKVKAW
jgi:chromosome segregation ATPase